MGSIRGTGLGRVVKVVAENHDVNSLYLNDFDESFAERKAGQWLSIRLPKDGGWSEPHPFTISCAPEDHHLRLTIKKIGEFTSTIPALKPGTEVKLAGPMGTFCRDIEAHPSIVLIAGGVGITPFLSVLRHFRHIRAVNRVKLFWSNKTSNDVFSAEELKAIADEINLRVIHVFSRQEDTGEFSDEHDPHTRYATGRMTRDVLKENQVSSDDAVYVCGPAPMQDFVLGELRSLGKEPSHVEKESFSWEKK